MFSLIACIFVRIFSNSYLNVFQKILTNNGEKPSVINFYTYLGLTFLGFIICPFPVFSDEIFKNFVIMGALGALGNYFIIKALSQGEMSTLAPINSYKPIVAMLLGVFILGEIPGIIELLGILLIVLGTLILYSAKALYNKAMFYRFLALIFSGTEAIFIKKIILLTDVPSSFLYWALASFIFTFIFLLVSKHSIILKKQNVKYQFVLIVLVALMQYCTNYVFSKMNVAYALALFQLSTLVSVYLGVNIFKESDFIKKILASSIMLIGAVVIIFA